MKKTVISIILTISLLFSFAIFVAGENTFKANASNNISSEVSEKLKGNIDYDYAIRIYNAGMYLHDFVDGKTLDEVVNTFPNAVERYFVVKGSLNEAEKAEYGVYTYKDGETKRFVESGIPEEAHYEWLKDTVSAKTLSIEGGVDKPITNIYCLRTYSPPRASLIVYQTLDATYYAYYNNGISQDPIYMSEDAFMAYAHAYVSEYRSHPTHDENGVPINWGGTVNVDPLSFGTLNISLNSKALVDDSTLDPEIDNGEVQMEKNDNFIKIIIVISAVVGISVIALITVLLVKRKQKQTVK